MVTIFSWGYRGWGNATHKLIQAVDATERTRGFKPPIFFDIRFKRNGRAVGFRNDAFEQLLPKGRYHWLPRLGNERIATNGHGIKIADPFAAKILLEEALHYSHDNRRIIFFCACEFPRHCHRRTVAQLLLDEATRIGRRLQVVEWPGGSPRHMTLRVDDSVIAKVRRLSNVPLGNQRLDHVSVPWGSIVDLESASKSFHIVAGPARFRDQWFLPFYWWCDSMSDKDWLLARANEFRHREGLEPSENVLRAKKGRPAR